MSNVPMAPILSHLSPASLGEVAKLINQKTSVETIYFFPISFITLLFILYFLANLLHNFILPKTIGHKWHKDIKPEHRRTMVVYVLQLIITTVALVLQLAVASLLKNDFSVWRLNVLRAAACLIAALYLFELIYRYRMTYPMISHHMITCFAMSLSLVMLERLEDPSYALTGFLWIFQATTEQTCFIALFMYRLSAPVKILRPLFRISAIQSLVFKFASIGGTVWVWAKYQRHGQSELSHAWTALFWTSTAGLAFSQIWGAWVVYKVGESLEKRYQQKQEQEEANQQKEFTPVLRRSGSSAMAYGKTSSSAGTSRSPSMQVAMCDLEKGAFDLPASRSSRY